MNQVQKAQRIFNAWIRERDKDKGCISCGAPGTEAGHYLSAGHFGALRFNEENVNIQCTRCNRFLHGNLIKYRIGLVRKIGEHKVMMLENVRHTVKKWSKSELDAIIQYYGKSKNKQTDLF